jgi:hypothetical protein
MTREFNRVSRGRIGRTIHEIKSIPQALQSSIDTDWPTGTLLFHHAPDRLRTCDLPCDREGYGAMTRQQYHDLAAMRRHPDYELALKSELDLTQLAGESDHDSRRGRFSPRLPSAYPTCAYPNRASPLG